MNDGVVPHVCAILPQSFYLEFFYKVGSYCALKFEYLLLPIELEK